MKGRKKGREGGTKEEREEGREEGIEEERKIMYREIFKQSTNLVNFDINIGNP